MKEALKYVWSYIRRYAWAFAAALILTIAVAGLSMVSPYATGKIVGEVIGQGLTERLMPYLWLMLGAALLIAALRYVYLWIFEDVSQKVICQIRDDIYRRIQRMDFRFFDKNRVGDLMSRLTGDIEAIRVFVAFVVYQLVINLCTFIFALVMMFRINVTFTLILLIVAPFIFVLAIQMASHIRGAHVEVREEYSRLNSMVQENISGNRVVKAFAKEDYEIEKFDQRNEAYKEANLAAARMQARYIPIMDALAVSLSFIMIAVGGGMCLSGSMSIEDLVMINGYLWAVNNPLRQFGWLLNDLMRFVAAYDKMKTVAFVEPTIKNPERPREVPVSGAIEFRDVSFRYDKEMILKNISFKAEPGQTVAVMGATGAGKSTMMNLIMRFYDVSSGGVYIDNINVKNLDKYKLRKKIAMTMQDVFLFSDTIEGNIAYGNPKAPMDEVEQAAELAGATEFITQFPEGFDTIVGERGVGLSGGQKQRLALARALLVHPNILILDDTTSALDMETEFRVFDGLKKQQSRQTRFIIAHRISSVKDADQILVLDHGEIVERGTHSELLALKGHYYEIYCQQMGIVKEGMGEGGEE